MHTGARAHAHASMRVSARAHARTTHTLMCEHTQSRLRAQFPQDRKHTYTQTQIHTQPRIHTNARTKVYEIDDTTKRQYNDMIEY